MAVFVLKDASVTINSVDLSAYVKRVGLTVSTEVQEVTAMGDNWRTILSGINQWTAEIEMHQDFAASQVDATLWAAFEAGVQVACVFKPTSAAVGAANPTFTGNGIVREYPPLGNSVGEPAMTSISIDGSGSLTRAVA